jgi:hypothetical protein
MTISFVLLSVSPLTLLSDSATTVFGVPDLIELTSRSLDLDKAQREM